jgi:predicted CoA-binding protein
VIGLSPKPHRDSYRVAAYLQAQGYRIIPVNPVAGEVLGEPAYPSLAEVPVPIDIVDVFRRSEFVPGIVDEAVACGARVLWTQYGIVHDEAAAVARAHGMDVVMDRCTQVEHATLVRQGKLGRGV